MTKTPQAQAPARNHSWTKCNPSQLTIDSLMNEEEVKILGEGEVNKMEIDTSLLSTFIVEAEAVVEVAVVAIDRGQATRSFSLQ